MPYPKHSPKRLKSKLPTARLVLRVSLAVLALVLLARYLDIGNMAKAQQHKPESVIMCCEATEQASYRVEVYDFDGALQARFTACSYVEVCGHNQLIVIMDGETLSMDCAGLRIQVDGVELSPLPEGNVSMVFR